MRRWSGASNPVGTTRFRYGLLSLLHLPLTLVAAQEVLSSRSESAVSTLAPARHDAVAAPFARSSGSPGQSPLGNARNLQDWEVEDFVLLATVDGSIHARDRKTGMSLWDLHVDEPMVQTEYHRRDSGKKRPGDDLVWIVEPSRDGRVYLYHSDPKPGVQRLEFTMKKLVELAPYASEEPSLVYLGDKRNKLYILDARTGSVVNAFRSGPHEPDRRICPVSDDLDVHDECATNRTLILGRTEYTLTIKTLQNEPICTIKYWEWGPNNRDIDLQAQYHAAMDNRYILSRYDGNILGYEHAPENPRPMYQQTLTSPVVRVFDVARTTDKSTEALVILPQPRVPAYDGSNRDNVYINRTAGGGWYAMSELSYPHVTNGAKSAPIYRQSRELPFDDSNIESDAIIGVHSLGALPDGIRFHEILSISGSEEPNLIDSISDNQPHDRVQPPLPEPPRQDLRPSLTGGRSIIYGLVVDNFIDMVLLVPLLTLIIFLYVNKGKLGKILVKKLDVEKMPVFRQVFASPPQSPAFPPPPETILVPESTEIEFSEGDIKNESSPIEGRVRFVEPDLEDNDSEATPKKRGGHRGKRGGKRLKARKGQTDIKTVPDDSAEMERLVQEVVHMPIVEPDPLMVARAARITGDITVGPGFTQINSLLVTSTVLGNGSHGTTVYKGTFEGRDVAVKRMLQAQYQMASHEINLLQESDDHPNVIRYFCKQETMEFLYIALELCEASLQQIVERPQEHANLIKYMDRANMLYQITNGVRHLHSLKIVHRDLKPQNILVTAPKVPKRDPSLTLPPRLLISDFGLCKKLEGDQSSFRATTANAAGTSGWRAPEVLRDEEAAYAAANNLDTVTSGSHSDAIVDPSTNRRATRAIDIFSLGCVFFYVLSQGSHPFGDDRLWREVKIVQGNYNLDPLLSLGEYSSEAIDIISRMIDKDPKKRPEAAAVIIHPFFWSAEKRLNFLVELSDRFEVECRAPPSERLQQLEYEASEIIGGDFLRRLDKTFVDTLGKQRKYTGSSMLDLLRALRNKKNHYQDMPQHVKERVGELPAGYLAYWTTKFPRLLLHGYYVALECGLDSEPNFKPYFTPPGRDG